MNRPMKFSAPDWCFFSDTAQPHAYYAALKAAGIDAVEMVPPDRRNAARAAGLTILNLAAPGMQDGLNNRRNHADLLAGIRASLREAADADIPHVIIFSGNRDADIHDGPQACADAIEQLLPDAEQTGRTMIFEMLNSFDHAGYEADHSAYGLRLAEQFNSPHLKVLLDLYHMQRMGEDPAALIRHHIDHIAHLHVAGSPNRDFPGPDQDTDYAACVQAAVDVGYRGFWGMEFLPGGDESVQALRNAVARFRSFS